MNIATPFSKNSACALCPRMCKADRTTTTGFCGCGALPNVAYFDLHHGEEPCISGTRGSGTIFFCGCSLRCAYCQNHEISGSAGGKTVSVEELAEIMMELENRGAHNINLVTPTHFSNSIAQALEIYRPKIPVVYNTSGYERKEILAQLEGKIDIYLTDLKYVDSNLSGTLSNTYDYFNYAYSAITEMIRQQPKCEFQDGIMTRGVIVRHLVLPSHLDDTRRVLEVFSENFKDNALLSLMSQYTPPAILLSTLKPTDKPEKIDALQKINRTLKPLEYRIALNYMSELKIKNGFYQSIDSATDEMLPDFFHRKKQS